jgi:hypothetical protein
LERFFDLIPGAVDLDSPFPSWPGDSPAHLPPHVVEGARYQLALTIGMVRQTQRRLVLPVGSARFSWRTGLGVWRFPFFTMGWLGVVEENRFNTDCSD